MALPFTPAPLPGSALPTPSAPCAGHLPPLEQFDIAIRLRTPLQPAAVSAIVRFLVDQGLRVLDVDQRGAVVEARGSVMAMSRAFRVQLRAYAGPDGPFRGRRGLIYVPRTLVDAIVAVDGLDARPDGTRLRPVTSEAPPITIDLRAPRMGRPRRPAGADHPAVRSGHPSVSPGAAARPAAVLRLLPLHGPEPEPVDTGDRAAAPVLARPIPLGRARTIRRGPLVRVAAEQRELRLARHFLATGVERP
jgi:hypothetical protein